MKKKWRIIWSLILSIVILIIIFLFIKFNYSLTIDHTDKPSQTISVKNLMTKNDILKILHSAKEEIDIDDSVVIMGATFVIKQNVKNKTIIYSVFSDKILYTVKDDNGNVTNRTWYSFTEDSYNKLVNIYKSLTK